MTPESADRLLKAVREYERLYNPRTGDPNRVLLKRVARWYRFTWRTLRDAVEAYERLKEQKYVK